MAAVTATRGVESRPVAAKRALGYLRVSTSLQAEKGMGLEVQRERIEQFAAHHGLELVDVVEETASGAVQNGGELSWEHRPTLIEVMERARRREFDVLLVARLDRLSRDYASLQVLERRLARYRGTKRERERDPRLAEGVAILSASETNEAGYISRYTRGNLALVAELERDVIADRLSAGRAKLRQRGRLASGQPPYGYRLPDTTDKERRGRLEPDPDRVDIVQRIFREAAQGTPLERIARGLNEDGIPSARGKRDRSSVGAWSGNGVGLIVRNRAYLGELHGQPRSHEPLVTVRLWNRANRALSARSRKPSG